MNYAWPTVRDKLLVGLSSFSKEQEEEEEEGRRSRGGAGGHKL